MSTGAQNFRIGSGSLAIAGEDVGLLAEDGCVIKYAPDVHLHMSAKYPAPVKASLVGVKLTIEMWMGEHTADNMESSFAGVTNNAGQIEFGGLAGREVEGKTMVLTPFDGTPAWYFRNVIPTESVDTNYKKNDERIIHVTFTGMIDMDAEEASNLGYFGQPS